VSKSTSPKSLWHHPRANTLRSATACRTALHMVDRSTAEAFTSKGIATDISGRASTWGEVMPAILLSNLQKTYDIRGVCYTQKRSVLPRLHVRSVE